MGKRGPKSKLTPEIEAILCQAIRAGNYAEIAASYADIDPHTFGKWLHQGQDDVQGNRQTASARLYLAVKRAEADAEVRAVASVASAFPKSWQAAMTFLERKYPHRWGRRDRTEHTVTGSVEARVAFYLPDNKRQDVIREAQAAIAEEAESLGSVETRASLKKVAGSKDLDHTSVMSQQAHPVPAMAVTEHDNGNDGELT